LGCSSPLELFPREPGRVRINKIPKTTPKSSSTVCFRHFIAFAILCGTFRNRCGTFLNP
jgi:hypothetical protein